MSEALKLIEDMISFDFSQKQNKKPGSGVILRYSAVIHRKFFFQKWYYLFKFFCRPLNVPVVPVSTSAEFISYRSSRKTRAATTFVLSNPDLASKDDSTARLAYRWREVM
jgi:hypothetical protein